ncbi:MAG: hypothetical protein V7603_4069 [Micromonosporaceae bacterium]
MTNFVLHVVRADDLLVLRFEFVNLVLDPDEGSAPRRLVRAAPAEEALLIVHFPPQHIAEEAFQPGTVDFARASVSRFISGESRLGFRLPPDVQALPLTIDDLLDWDRFEAVLAPGAREEPPEDVAELGINMPLSHQTAIELPFRLTLSPGEHCRWEHRVRPFASGDRVEVWHTRLVAMSGRPLGAQLPLSAVWSPDHPDFNPVEDQFTMSLNHKQRSEIVQLSSDFSLLDESNFHGLDESQSRRLEALRFGRSSLLLGENLMLSALGGWLRVRSRFDFPAIPVDLFVRMEGHEMGPFSGGDTEELFSLSDWSHIIAMGRDQYAQTVERGFLFPFGHRADLVTTTERTFVSNGIMAELQAYLLQRQYLIIQEPERQYHNNHGLPFVSMRITIPVTPELDLAPAGNFVPRVGQAPYAFPVRATDHQGSTTEVRIPMVWVPLNEMGDLDHVRDKYDQLSRVDFFNQSVAFAPDDNQAIEGRAGSPARPGRTTLKALAIQFEHGVVSAAAGGPSFRPLMKQAEVHLPVVDHLGLSTRGASKITLHPAYVAGGFAGVREGVFARIVDGLPLQLPAEKAGGLLALQPARGLPPGLPVPPGLELNGLSLDHGAVPNVDGLVQGFSSPQVIDGLAGRLLGVIDLKDIIASVTRSSELPKLETEAVDGGHQVAFKWNPPIRKDSLPHPLKPAGEPALSIAGTLFRPNGSRSAAAPARAASADVDGILSDVALSFLDVLTVGFSKIRFHTKTGQKPDFGAEIKNFEFSGDLAFVNRLAALLRDPQARGSSSGGPTVVVTPEGISAGITLTVPTFDLGAFSLRSLAFSSTLSLYFIDKPAAIRFALSSLEDPFLVSYSVFGGGGHFALTARTEDTPDAIDVEASLEFGASVTVNLFVATGTAQVMAGVLFATKGKQVTLAGYVRIHGCLEILGIVSVSVDFHLSLTYQRPNATGRASLTVMVRVLAFSKSVTLTVERSFNVDEIPLNSSFGQTVSQQDWRDYCDAFA